MKIIPSHYIEFRTYLSCNEVERALKEHTKPKGIFTYDWGKKDKTPFEGIIGRDSFLIQRNINYKNSFLPQIIGKFEKENDQTKIYASLEVLNFVYYFVAIFISLALTILFCVIHFIGFSNFELIIIPLGFILFIVALAWTGFNIEKNQSIELLKDILKASK